MGRILIADENRQERDLLGLTLMIDGHEVDYAGSGRQVLKQAAQNLPDLVLMSAALPDLDGLEACRHLRLDPLLAEVPVFLIASAEHPDARQAGFEAGADDVLSTPNERLDEVRTRVRNLARLNRFRKLATERAAHEQARVVRETSSEAVLLGWARALELRGLEPEGHIQRVLQMTLRLAREMKFPAEAMGALRMGVLLHDSGKFGVACDGLQAGRVRTPREQATLRKHPETAYDLFCNADAMQPVIEIPYCHHERWDGSGYPRGLKGAEIPLAARIFAVADAWDILTAAPPCGKGWTRAFARQQIVGQAGMRFDPDVVCAFEKILTFADLEEAAVSGNPPNGWFATRRMQGLSRFSMASRGAMLHFISALMLISVIPALAVFYVSISSLTGTRLGWGTLGPLIVVVVALMMLGYSILAKYPASVVRLRHWVEELARGNLPVRIELSADEDDLAAIERCLHEVVRQSKQRVDTLEEQTEALLVAERQRVAIEGLGAACHHLGQPATSLSLALYMMRCANTSPEITPLIDQCQQSADAVSEILHKLQSIANYRTEPYLSAPDGHQPAHSTQTLKL